MTKQHSTLVLSVVVVVGLLLLAAAMSVNALAAKGAQGRSDKPTVAKVKVIWNATVGASLQNAPTLDPSQNWLYVNGGTEVAILDARNGSMIKSVTNQFNIYGVGVSNIVLAGGKIYYAGNRKVVSQNATTLAMNWNFTAPQAFQTPLTYVPWKNALFVGSRFELVFYRIDSITGDVVWNATQFAESNTGTSAQSTFSTKHNLVIIPLLAEYFPVVVALNGTTGSKVWNQSTNGQCAPGILSDDEDLIYYGSLAGPDLYGALYAFATASGKVKWQFSVLGEVAVAPLLHNGALFFNTANGAVCYSIDANTGKQIWANRYCQFASRYRAEDTQGDFYNYGFVRLYGDTFLVPSAGGVTAISLGGSGFVWSWTGASGSVANIPPPTSDGKLFLGSLGGKVYALQLPPSGNTKGVIVEKNCADTACSSGCVTRRSKSGQCLQNGASSSIVRTCTLSGGAVLVKTFFQSPSCDANSPVLDRSVAQKTRREHVHPRFKTISSRSSSSTGPVLLLLNAQRHAVVDQNATSSLLLLLLCLFGRPLFVHTHKRTLQTGSKRYREVVSGLEPLHKLLAVQQLQGTEVDDGM